MTAFRSALFLLFAAIAAASICLSIFWGNDAVQAAQLMHAFGAKKDALAQQVLFLVRIPHALTAFVTGGLLALAGVIMQSLVRNPLADPYVLGTSGGAALFTLSLMLLGFGEKAIALGGWLGSFAANLLVFGLSKKSHRGPEHLLLAGIAVAGGFSALISLILFISPAPVLRGLLFWLMGDLSYARTPGFESFILGSGLIWALYSARDMNILIKGQKEAAALGVNTQRLQWKLYFLSALLTATAVSLAGCIGFVGLIIPHLLRLSLGYDHRLLLPASVAAGGALLTLADLIARNIAFPLELPVGIIMTLTGIPIFICLLQKRSV